MIFKLLPLNSELPSNKEGTLTLNCVALKLANSVVLFLYTNLSATYLTVPPPERKPSAKVVEAY